METSPQNERVTPEQEMHQPDPMLQMSVGKMGAGAVTLAAVFAAVVVGIVFYGLNSGNRTEQAKSFPSAHNAQPQPGGQPGPTNATGPRANESGLKG